MMHAMDVHTEINYPDTTPDQIFAMGMTQGFRQAVCIATRARDFDVSIREHEDGRASVVVQRTMPADLSGVARRVIGETIEVVQNEEWSPAGTDGARTADLIISIRNQPARMAGSIVLEPFGTGVRMRIAGKVKVSIPFVGKKIEPEVARAIILAAAKEQQTGLSWLHGGPERL